MARKCAIFPLFSMKNAPTILWGRVRCRVGVCPRERAVFAAKGTMNGMNGMNKVAGETARAESRRGGEEGEE